MLRGLPCRSAGLTKSSGACSTASGCCSSARGSWTGSTISSWTASFVASTRIKICHATVRTQCNAWVLMMRCNEIQCKMSCNQDRPTLNWINTTTGLKPKGCRWLVSRLQIILAWSISFQKQLLIFLRAAWIKTETCFAKVTHAWNKQLTTFI